MMKLLSSIVLSSFLSISVNGQPTAPSESSCYTSTAAMLQAQAMGEKTLIICPNTTIPIGFPTDATFSSFVGGDLPLAVLGDNVTIQCGDDGKSSNYCALKGGLVQFATAPALAQAPGLGPITTHNLVVQGLTFTGMLTGTPDVNAVSVSLSTPGLNMVFEDVVFEDMTASQGILIDRNLLVPEEAFPLGSASLTIRNSRFSEITYTNLVSNFGHAVTLDNVQFQDLLYKPCPICSNQTNYTSLDAVVYAGFGGELNLIDVDFTNIEFDKSVVYIRGNDTVYTLDGVTGSNWEVYDLEGCEEGLIVATSEAGTLDLTSDEDTCLPLLTVETGVEKTMIEDKTLQEDENTQGQPMEALVSRANSIRGIVPMCVLLMVAASATGSWGYF